MIDLLKNIKIRRFSLPIIMLLIMWFVKIFETISGTNLWVLGIYPLKVFGLIGIVTSPFVHENYSHLISNTVPFLILSIMLFYFYYEIRYRIFFLLYFTTNFWVWFIARPSYHIGASGLIYAMAAFLFFSGLFRKNIRLSALSLVVIFLYGSLIWGAIPGFLPDKNISWESHLMGLVSGIVFSVFYRKFGPKDDEYEWEEESETDDDILYEEDQTNIDKLD